ncbi:MAG TPA: CBS domain-containing protein [Acidimicrobiales bacterium]|nr:CBS domain-containing protein [Acidimicrobiales bacterium]
MTLRDLATCPAVTCSTDASVQEAAHLMATAGVGFLVIVDADHPVGVLTDRDIVLRGVAAGCGPETPVAELMTRHPAHVDEHATVEQAATVMADKQCRRVAITGDGGRIVGVLSLDDLLRVAGDELQQVARAVRGSKHAHPTLP